MSTDPDNPDLPDGLAQAPADTSDERVDALADVSDEDLRAALLKRLQRAGDDEPRARGDQVHQLEMDHPPAAPDEPLLHIGYALLPQLPEHWKDVFLDVTSAADEVRTLAIVRMHEDEPLDSRFHFFSDLAEPSLALRRSTYEPDGCGAWYNAMIRLSQDGAIDANFDFERPPFGCWGPNEAALVLRDQELYPRDPARLPPWHPAR